MKTLLTGKTLEQFEEWYKDVDKSGIKSMPYTTLKPYVCFLNIDFSMQYGVLEDFFDTKNIFIEIQYNPLAKKFGYWIELKPVTDDIMSRPIYNRNEARRKAIEKANELNNKQNQ